MKKIAKLFIIILLTLTVQTAAARRSGAASRLEQVKTTTEMAVDSLKVKARNLNTDSVATTVIITTHPDKEATIEARNHDNDDNIESHSDFPLDFGEALGLMFILILLMLFPAAIVLGCVFIIMRSKSKLKRQRYELIRHCVDAGAPLPKAFYLSELPRPSSYLRSGIVWMGWGLSATVLYALDNESFFLAVGIVLIFIGLSRLALFRRLTKEQTGSRYDDITDVTDDNTDESPRC